jgi:hypothetical protein
VVNARKTKAGPTGGAHSSAREEGETVPVREIKEDGPQAASGAGPIWFPGVHFYFYFSFASFLFCFLYFFIHFSNLNQIDSNQLCKVSKIQNNHTEQ